MKESPYSPGFEPLEQFKREAGRVAPAPVDFSERVMRRIERESVGVSEIHGAPELRQRGIVIALIAVSVMLLSGFTYALTTGLLIVKDGSGREIMQVKSPEAVPAEKADLADRIRKAVEDQLLQGEAALILIGQENIDAAKRREEPKEYLSVNRGYEYSSTKALSSRLIGYLGELNNLGDQVGDAKIVKAKVLYFPGRPDGVQPDRWVETTDAASGLPYAYHKLKTDEKAYISADDVVRLTYREGNSTFTLMGHGGNYDSFTVYDRNPSEERVYEVGEIPIYHTEGQDEPFLIWSQSVQGGKLGFFLISDAEIGRQLDFVEAVILATSD